MHAQGFRSVPPPLGWQRACTAGVRRAAGTGSGSLATSAATRAALSTPGGTSVGERDCALLKASWLPRLPSATKTPAAPTIRTPHTTSAARIVLTLADAPALMAGQPRWACACRLLACR